MQLKDMARKEDGENMDDVLPGGDDTPTPAKASQFVPRSNPDTSATILTEDEAERKGDFTALLRIRLANAARETSEKIDINGDGIVMTGLSTEGESVLYGRDEYGGYYAKDGFYHDKFGGYYDDFGYHDKSGSFTTNSGAHWDAATGKMTNADGTERKVVSEVVRDRMKKDPKLGETVTMIDEQFNQDENAKNGNTAKPKTDTAGAAATEGGGRKPSGTTTSTETREKTESVIEERIANGQNPNGPATTEEITRANERFKRKSAHVENRRGALSEFLVSQNAATGTVPDATSEELQQANAAYKKKGGSSTKPTFTAVSKEEATTKIGHVHLPAKKGAHVHGPEDHGSPTGAKQDAPAIADGDKPKDQKTDAAASSTNWYKDERGGYWDEYGGYYDKDGGYWEVDGGYWDRFNVYTDVKGGRTWPDGSYLDPNFNYVDKDGCYFMEDGTKIKPPAGMDFKKQMQEAAMKGEEWHLPEELKPLLSSKMIAPDLTLKATSSLAPIDASLLTPMKLDQSAKTEPVTGVALPVKLEPVPLKLEPIKIGANLELPPLKLDTNFGATTSRSTSFSLVDSKPGRTPIAGDGTHVDTDYQLCTTQGNPKNDFSSFFNNYHSFLTSSKPETKFYDLSNITLSPSVDATTQLAVLKTPADEKSAVPAPKLA
jgi:hypothetical protein